MLNFAAESPEMGLGGFDVYNVTTVFFGIAGELDEAEASTVALKHSGVFGGGAIDENFVSVADTGFVFSD